MAVAKSPFLVIQDFLSPKLCEKIVDNLEFYSPDTNDEGKPIKMFKYHTASEEIVFNRLKPMIPDIMEYFQSEYRGTEQIMFEYLAESTVSEPLCENSNYIKKKWVRTKDRDFTGLLFLTNYNDDPDFDSDYEVYGGKLEFPQHGFGFNPSRGTMIIYPSGPHFINANAAVVAGDLHQSRVHIAASMPYLYDPEDFPGDMNSWFIDLK